MGAQWRFLVAHTTLQFNVLAFLALIVLIATIVHFVLSKRKFKKDEEQLEDRLAAGTEESKEPIAG